MEVVEEEGVLDGCWCLSTKETRECRHELLGRKHYLPCEEPNLHRLLLLLLRHLSLKRYDEGAVFGSDI